MVGCPPSWWPGLRPPPESSSGTFSADQGYDTAPTHMHADERKLSMRPARATSKSGDIGASTSI